MITSQSWFKLSRIFSRSVFPTILQHGTGLFRLEGILSVMLDKKSPQHSTKPGKTDDIAQRHQKFLREMTSEKRAHKFHTDDASLPKTGQCFWLVEANFTSGTTNQKHYPDLGSDASSVWNFCVVVTLRIVLCFLRLHLSRTLCKSPLIGVSKSKCLPVFRSLPRRRSASGTGTREEPWRTTSAWEAMSSVQK